VHPRRPRASAARDRDGLGWLPLTAYGLLSLLLAGYLASLIVRSPDQSSPVLDGWSVGGFEVALSFLCFARAFSRHRERLVPIVFGAALLSWALGDFLLTAFTSGEDTTASPSLPDVFYIGFYPLAYVAIVQLMRRGVGRLSVTTWLDGGVAGLGAAALCASFALNALLHATGGDPASVAINLAYPVGDLLLLALVIGGSAILPSRRNAYWVLLATACAVNAAGDTFNLFHDSAGSSHIGTIVDGVAWPAAILLMSLSVWLSPVDRHRSTQQHMPGFLLPGLGAASGLAVLFAGTVHRVDPPALGLAIATLVMVGVRLVLSVRGLRRLTEERHRQALTDELTGLGNRRRLLQLFDEFFGQQRRAAGAENRLAFLFIDLNHFKEVNDAFGHAAGDDLLKQLGPRLKGALRTSDTLVRIGGDELGVVLTDTDVDHATAVAHRVAAKLEEPFVVGNVRVRVGASIGIAVAPLHATDSVGLMRCADVAMYRAKASDSIMQTYAHDIDGGGNRLRLVEDLRHAIQEGQFVMHYQPQIDLQSGHVCAVEALLRWPHPTRGFVPPLDFLPLAEEAGLMPSLTAWVLARALEQCAEWRREAEDVAVAVNISASNLLDPSFIDQVRDLLAYHQLPPSALILEITETTVLGDFDRCQRVIAELRALGLDTSIDDFGAGFTSLAYLGRLAVRELKLDRTFITQLTSEQDGSDTALVRATIELGHALGLRVVAEGIEDRATLELLARAGCDLAQGYYISRPMPAADISLAQDPLANGAVDRRAS
jgi:diguanylate cyclase